MLVCHFLTAHMIMIKTKYTTLYYSSLTDVQVQMFPLQTTWWQQQQQIPTLAHLNFTPGSGSSFLSCFCFRKRHSEVRSCQRVIQMKS